MKSFFKEKPLARKIIIAIVIVLLFNFISPTISSASIGGILFEPIKDLLLVIADGIISLSQDFIFDLDVSFLTIYHKDSGWSTVASVAGAILGVAVAVVAAPFTGGFSIVAALALGAGGAYVCGQIAADSIPPTFKLPIFLLTPENMFNNSIPFLDINFFETADDKGATEMDIDGDGNMDGYYVETNTTTGEVIYQKSSALVLKSTISQWYYALRNFAIVALLCILVYTAIRIIISSSAEDKAKYKQKLFDWLIAMCLLFFMHYIMAFAVTLTESITDAVNSMNKPYYIYLGSTGDELADYKYGNGASDDEGAKIFDSTGLAETFRTNGVIATDTDTGNEVFMWPTNLMGKARMELQLEPTDLTEDDIEMRQFGYTVVYLVLVIYTMLFLFRYLKRLLMLTFLTIIAPLMAMTYPLDKMQDGSAQGFNTWLKEYLYNLLIQPVHLILYTVLIGSAMDLVQDNVLYAIVALGFLLEAEKLLRRFFGFDKSSTVASGSALGGALAMQGLNSVTKMLGRGGKGGKSGVGNKNVGAGKQKELTRGKDSDKDINALYASGADALEGGSAGRGGDDSGSGSGSPITAPNGQVLVGTDGRPLMPANQTPAQTSTEESTPPEDTRGLGRYAFDSLRGTRAGQAVEGGLRAGADWATSAGRTIRSGVAKPFVAAGTGIRNFAVNHTSEGLRHAAGVTGKNLAKHAKTLGRGMKYVAPKAASFAARTAVKGTLAGTGAMIGMAAGLASDDPANVAKWAAGGAVGGWAAGSGVTGMATQLDNTVKGLPDELYEATHSADEIKARRNAKLDEEWLKDSKAIEKYAEQFGCGNAEAKEIMEKEAKEFRKYGITDDDLIIKAMKANASEFGGRTSNQRILLAQLASQVNSSKDADQVESRLKKRNFSEDRAKKYADQIRKMKGLV